MSFIHSIFEAVKKKHIPEKKTAFSFIQKISPKSAQKQSYPGKKNTVPLPEAKFESTPGVVQLIFYGLLSFVTSELKMDFNFGTEIRQTISEKKPLLYEWDGWMDGPMDGWTDIKSVLRFSSKSSIITNKMC